MAGSTRRAALAQMLGAGGLVLSAPQRALAVGALPPLEIALPPHPMRLTRLLRRQLGADAVLEIRRSWDIGFARVGRGIVVTGAQADVVVDAPPHLAEFARIEQARRSDAMFPIMLDEGGMIGDLSRADTDVRADEMLAEAIAVAQRLIARAPGPASREAGVQHYLVQLQQAGAGLFDRLPGDLFFPAGRPIIRSGILPLPGGATGEFSLTYSAQTMPGTPWLADAEREIVTRIGEHQRRSREEWKMAPAPATN